MNKFPKSNEIDSQNLLENSADILFNLAEQLKIENLNKQYLSEIVIPLS